MSSPSGQTRILCTVSVGGRAVLSCMLHFCGRIIRTFVVLLPLLRPVLGFWDLGTSTMRRIDPDTVPRTSFFTWPLTTNRPSAITSIFYWGIDYTESDKNRKCRCMAGISIDKLTLSAAVLVNRRTLISAANYLEPYMHRQKDLRVWALGRGGKHNTPYRYRVWRVRRIFPKSNNPEHYHGSSGEHVPRHDVAVIHTLDQMYLYQTERYNYAARAFLPGKHEVLSGDRLWITGAGWQSLKDIRENYKIKQEEVFRGEVVDCSKYLPKWWGKFICLQNRYHWPGVNNGMGLMASKGYNDYVYALGCFEIRYNEDQIMVFTDLRYYIDRINVYANITPGDYYEYAYPHWGIRGGWTRDENYNTPFLPSLSVWHDMFPLGK